MHKVEVERMRGEVILEIMVNQEESQRGGGLNREDWMIVGIVEYEGIRRNIARFERTMEETNKMETRRQMW